MSLKIPASTDPFLLSDFALNWGILDASPGTYVCTSGSRPLWGSAQAGRQIFMTDYRQTSWWNGSTWLDPENSVPCVAGGVTLNQSIAKSASPVNQVVALTLSRPCTLAISMVASYQCQSDTASTQSVHQRIVMDGTDLLLGGHDDQHSFALLTDDSYVLSIPSVAVASGLPAGAHIISVKSIIGSENVSVQLNDAKVIAFVTAYNTGNAL
jgi:hypothetical protein